MQKLEKKNIEDILSLTPMQEGMLFHYLEDPGSDFYFEQLTLDISGDIEKPVFEKAWNFVVESNEMLRTLFRWEKVEHPMQIVLKKYKLQPRYYDCSESGEDVEEKKKQREEIKIKDKEEKFDLREVPFKVTLCKYEEKRYEIVISNHHILYDGWSSGIILEEFFNAYNDLSTGKKLVKPVKTKFKDFIKWYQKQLASSDKHEKFWRDYLNGFETQIDLSIKKRRGEGGEEGSNAKPGSFRTRFDRNLKTELEHFAKRQTLTLASLLYSAWGLLLQQYNNCDDLVFGTTVAGRPSKINGIEEMVGLFINTLPLRIQSFPGEITVDFLNRINHSLQIREEYEVTPLVKIKKYSEIDNNEPLFDTIVVIENYPLDSRLMTGKDNTYLSVDSYSMVESTHYDLSLGITLSEDIELAFIYDKDLFDKEALVRLSGHFKCIVEDIIKNPGKEVFDVDLIGKEEKNKLLYEFNRTEWECSREKTLYRLFEEQVEITPDNIGIVGPELQNKNCKTVSLTYKELNEKSDRLAHMLRSKGVGPDTIAAIMIKPSVEMIIGLLGILKSGGAYLPIDPEYPGDRIRYMLADSKAKILVTTHTFAEESKTNFEVMFLDSLELSGFSSSYQPNVSTSHPSNPAYIIYTSGTTGQPKGVLIRHRSVVNTLLFRKKEYKMNGDVSLQLFSYSFDGFITSFFTPLISGSRIILLPGDEVKDINRITESIATFNVTHFICIPPLYRVILEHLTETIASRLKVITLAGDNILPNILELTKQKSRQMIEIVNEYGVTEGSVLSTLYRHQERDAEIKIGRPIGNTAVYILDKREKLQPIGVPGELCICGAGVAVGYLNNPQLTYEKFTRSLYRKEETVYKTGDLARWLPDGNIQLAGRIDHQVKVRGFRIELGEIEEQLSRHNEIKDVVVIKGHRQHKDYLCAYIVPCTQPPGNGLKIDALREYLSGKLPDYMIPAYFVRVDNIPLTPNGKIDRKGLPDPEMTDSDGYIPPGNDLEKKFVETWSNILGVEKIGIKDNFFNLGGDSIKIIQLQARMHKFGYKLEIDDIYKNPTISELAKKAKKEIEISDQSLITGDIPLTPIQKDLLVNGIDIHHFNQSVMLNSKERLDENLIRRIFREIQAHHDALRITIEEIDGKMFLKNHGLDYPFGFESYDLSADPDDQNTLLEKVNIIQSSIDLKKGPLMKVSLFRLNDGDRLLIVIHHLVVDGISWRILFEDIENLYQQYVKGKKELLPKKSDSFKRWAEKLNEYSRSGDLLKEIEYWEKIDGLPIQKIRRDFDKDFYEKDSEKVSFGFSKERTEELLTKANTAYNTNINDILLTALGLGVWKTFGIENVFITLEGHGRENIIENIDISRTVGWFTITYPVMLDMKYSGDLSRQIKEVKETLRKIPNGGIGYGILKYLAFSEHEQCLILEQQPQIEFNYLGQFDPDVNQMSLFEIAGEPMGDTVSLNRKFLHDFSIYGMIVDHRLTFTLAYSKKQYKRETVQKLIENYKKELDKVIDHCVKLERKEFTPSDFTYKNFSIDEIDVLSKEYEIEDIYPLSPMQEGMLFHWLQDSSSASYLEQISYCMKGDLKPRIVEKTLNELFKRHDILRSTFIYEYKRPLQAVLRNRRIDFIYKDLRGESDDKKREWLEDYKKRDRNNTFSMKHDVLMRFALFQVAEKAFEVIWTFHHILMDGWCIGVIHTEFLEIYSSFLENRAPQLSPITSYRRYIEWLEKRDKQASDIYWKKYLDAFEGLSGIPDRGRQKESEDTQDYKNEDLLFFMDKEQTGALYRLAARNQVTVNTILQAVWAIVLGRYSGKRDVVFGAVVSGRPQEVEGVETMIGLFINTIPVRIKYEEDITFKNLIQQVREAAVNSEPHHYYPLRKIQPGSTLKRNLFNHLFVFENFPTIEEIERVMDKKKRAGNGLKLEISNVNAFEQSHYDLNVRIGVGDRLKVEFKYNANVYDREGLEKVYRHFEEVFSQVIENENLQVKEIAMEYNLLDVKADINNEDYVFSF